MLNAEDEENHKMKAQDSSPSLKDDLLDGVKEFADFLGWDEQVTYRMLRQGHIPGQQMGRKWVGTKSAVRARFQSAA